MCDNFPNIRITEGNNFSIILPLLSRTYVATRPIDEEIDPEQLENVVVTFGGVQYQAQRTERGVQIDLPATLAVGTYNILLTAEYLGSNIRAAYESAVTIVPWSEQSTAEQYIAGSPIVLRAAYVLSGALTDAELESLKEEYREKKAQLAQAIAYAEAAKREWEEKAAELDGVAKEQTLTQGVQDIRDDISHIDIDTSTLAKEATSQEIKMAIGTPASGQPSTLFGAIGDVALNAQTLQSLADSWAAMVTNRSSMGGYKFKYPNVIEGVGDIFARYTLLQEVYDESITTIGLTTMFASPVLERVELPNLEEITNGAVFQNTSLLKTCILPKLKKITNATFTGSGIEEIELPELTYVNGGVWQSCSILKKIYIPKISSINGNTFASCANLIDIKLGAHITTSFSISSWSPTNALSSSSSSLVEPDETFANNLEKLLYNIREHIAANLPDRTGLSGLTITFSAAVKAAILADQPTADAFTNKNWTIA